MDAGYCSANLFFVFVYRIVYAYMQYLEDEIKGMFIISEWPRIMSDIYIISECTQLSTGISMIP